MKSIERVVLEIKGYIDQEDMLMTRGCAVHNDDSPGARQYNNVKSESQNKIRLFGRPLLPCFVTSIPGNKISRKAVRIRLNGWMQKVLCACMSACV